MQGIKECIIEWGDSNHLVGLLTEPQQTRGDAPILLLLNAGLVHHVGPFRMNTDFARALSLAGHTCFRFDLSGIGDSDSAGSATAADARFIADIRSAMDCLQYRFGAHRRFIILGLCTGADNAHKVACRDDRICGAIFLDGYCYPSAQFYWHRLGPFLSSPARMSAWLKRKLNGTANRDNRNLQDAIFTWTLPPKEQACADWSRMLENGMQLLFVYSHGALNQCNYENQLFDAVAVMRRHASQVTVKRFADADHTYTLTRDRAALLALLQDWLSRF